MSGGHYDYAQNRIHDIVRKMDIDIVEYSGDHPNDEPFPDDVLAVFKVTHDMLRVLETLVERCDYLISADDGPESFRARVAKDLKRLGLTTPEAREIRKKIISKLGEAQ